MKNVTARIRTKLLAGVVVVVPAVATFLALRVLFRSLDAVLGPWLGGLINRQIPGLGRGGDRDRPVDRRCGGYALSWRRLYFTIRWTPPNGTRGPASRWNIYPYVAYCTLPGLPGGWLGQPSGPFQRRFGEVI